MPEQLPVHWLSLAPQNASTWQSETVSQDEPPQQQLESLEGGVGAGGVGGGVGVGAGGVGVGVGAGGVGVGVGVGAGGAGGAGVGDNCAFAASCFT